jgi:hypothetical protein
LPTKNLVKLAMAVGCMLLSATCNAYEGYIEGEFNGWEGTSVYKLDDGHVIQQTEYRYEYHYAYHPKILITGGNGGYKAWVEGTSEAVGIEVLK